MTFISHTGTDAHIMTPTKFQIFMSASVTRLSMNIQRQERKFKEFRIHSYERESTNTDECEVNDVFS